MNKLVVFYVIMLMFLPTQSFGEKVTININADVIERSCTISDSSLNKTVSLQSGDVRNSSIGVPFAGSKFTISLESCPENISSVNIIFKGETDSVMNTLLKNSGDTESSAKGIALGLYDSDNNKIDINKNINTLEINHGLSINTYDFFVRYIRVSDTYSPGEVLSVANFELSYD